MAEATDPTARRYRVTCDFIREILGKKSDGARRLSLPIGRGVARFGVWLFRARRVRGRVEPFFVDPPIVPDAGRPMSRAAAPAPRRLIRAYKHGWPRLACRRDDPPEHSATASSRSARRGIDGVRQALDEGAGGVLFAANHSCWWDLYLAHFLNETIPVDGYGMMEHANLTRFGFFRRIGAFSVDRSSPAGVRASIDYASSCSGGRTSGVWIFPQGKIVGNDVRPLGFQPGLRTLVRRAGRVRIVPVALRYEFWQDERPEAFVRFGEPSWSEAEDAASIVESTEKPAHVRTGRAPRRRRRPAVATGS